MKKSPLYTSVHILDSSVELLNSSIRSLEYATRDVKRIKTVLNTQKVFGVVPELDLESAKRQVQSETNTQVSTLMGKLEKELERLRRKKAGLENKFKLQQVRLETAEKNGRESFTTTLRGGIHKSAEESKISRLRLLQNKKERLKYSLSRMNLQDTKARLSMIPSLPPQK